MNEKAPARGQRLNLELDPQDRSTNPIKHKGIKHLRTLREIGEKWVDRRCYRTLDRALRALIRGDL